MTSRRVDGKHEGGAARRPRGRGPAAGDGDVKAPSGATPTPTPVPDGAAPAKGGPPPLKPGEGPLDLPGFFEAVVYAGSVGSACKIRGTTLGEYVARRLADATFDEAMLRADQVLDLQVVDRVREAAQDPGALAAQALYLKSVRLDAMQASFPSQRRRPGPDDAPAMDPDVAAAMIKAGLEAHEKAVLAGKAKAG